MIEQYRVFKKNHPDAILLLRNGDFYETYEEDAERVADIVGTTLTRHRDGYLLTMFPHVRLDVYLPKLVRGTWKRIGVIDKLEKPATGDKPSPVEKKRETATQLELW